MEKKVNGIWKPKLHSGLRFYLDKLNYMVIPYNKSIYPSSEITIIAIFEPNALTDFHDIISRHTDATNANGTIRIYNSHIQCLITISNKFKLITSNKEITKGVPCMSALTYNGRNVSLYIDGNLDKSLNAEGKIAKTTLPTYIASVLNSPKLRKYAGIVYLVRIYNRALSPSEIKYAYRHPFDTIDKDALVLDLNPAGIDIANAKWWDLSGNGNHGTIYNATEVKLIEEEVSVL